MAPSAARLTAGAQAAYLTASGALTSGLAFGFADVRASRTESRIYLADLALQAVFAAAWLRPWSRGADLSPPREPAATCP